MATQRAVCIVRDEALSKKEFVVEPSLPVMDFRKMVAENFEHEAEELDLFLQNSLCSLTIIDHTKTTLHDTGLSFDPDVRNNIMIMPKRTRNKDNNTSSSPSSLSGSSPKVPSSSKRLVSDRILRSGLKEDDYIGLRNDGNICYLNSILQLMFMTPELRNAVIGWNIQNVSEPDYNLLTELQELFVLLRMSGKPSLSIMKFIRAFTWSQSRNQQDIAETITLLFSDIKKALEVHREHDIIKDLYEGSIENYVCCKKCNNQNSTKCEFIDIRISLRKDSGEKLENLEQALSWFLQPELLTGSNKYNCETCQSKADADKGIKITKLPYILNFFLTRTAFNPITCHLEKINDRFEYPLMLELSDEKGTHSYELYGIVLHSGTATTGHYFAYLKNLHDANWYMFNDQKVLKIYEEQVYRGFGCDPGSKRSTEEEETYLSCTNAYMLSYRKISKDENKNFQEIANFCKETRDRISNILAIENEFTASFTCFFKNCDSQVIHQKFEVNIDKSINYLRNHTYNYFMGNVARYNINDYRLMVYNRTNDEVREQLKYNYISDVPLAVTDIFLKKVPTDPTKKAFNILAKYSFDSLEQTFIPTTIKNDSDENNTVQKVAEKVEMQKPIDDGLNKIANLTVEKDSNSDATIEIILISDESEEPIVISDDSEEQIHIVSNESEEIIDVDTVSKESQESEFEDKTVIKDCNLNDAAVYVSEESTELVLINDFTVADFGTPTTGLNSRTDALFNETMFSPFYDSESPLDPSYQFCELDQNVINTADMENTKEDDESILSKHQDNSKSEMDIPTIPPVDDMAIYKVRKKLRYNYKNNLISALRDITMKIKNIRLEDNRVDVPNNFQILLKCIKSNYLAFHVLYSCSFIFNYIGDYYLKSSVPNLAEFSFKQGLIVMLLNKEWLKTSPSVIYKMLLKTMNLKIIKKSICSKDINQAKIPFIKYLICKQPKKLYMTLTVQKTPTQIYSVSIAFLLKH